MSKPWYSKIKPDTLPLTGRERSELLECSKQSLKGKPSKIISDIIRKGLWPEEKRDHAIAYLQQRHQRHLDRLAMRSSGVDRLALRRTGHALRNFAALKEERQREELKKRQLEYAAGKARTIEALDVEGVWNKTFSTEVYRWTEAIQHGMYDALAFAKYAVNKANLEAVPRILKKDGWIVRHASENRAGRKSSRYFVSPDRQFEVRLSDHALPDTPERHHNRLYKSERWNYEIVLSGVEKPLDLVADVKHTWADNLEDKQETVPGM